MLKYDLMVLKLSFSELALAIVDNVPRFVKYFIKETDLQAIAGNLQKRINELDSEIQDLDSMLRERNG